MLNIVIVTLMSFGLFFFFGTVVGLIRFPDFYTRMHAAGKGDTLSSALLLTGLALYHLHHLNYDTILVSVKIMFIVLFVFIASPTATHAIMDAGYETNAKPWVKKQKGQDEHPEEEKVL